MIDLKNAFVSPAQLFLVAAVMGILIVVCSIAGCEDIYTSTPFPDQCTLLVFVSRYENAPQIHHHVQNP